MTITVSPSESNAHKALRDYLLSILPSGVEVVRGQANRVAQPEASNFVVMTPIRRERPSTNFDEYVDTRMTAAIDGTTMTVTEVDYGSLKVGSAILGVDVAPGTRVTVGSGGVGSYQVTPSQTVSSRVLAAGVLAVTQPTELTIQLDVHGPNGGDNAQRIANMLRDDHCFLSMQRAGTDVRPLNAENPRQMPFITGEDQYEDRWIVEACLQVNATVHDIPQEFFEEVEIGRRPADIEYPA